MCHVGVRCHMCACGGCWRSPTVYAFQRNVYVLMGTQLYMWDAFLPHQVRNVTITVSDCNIAGTKDQADALKSAAVRNGLFMFTAFKRCVRLVALLLRSALVVTEELNEINQKRKKDARVPATLCDVGLVDACTSGSAPSPCSCVPRTSKRGRPAR